MRKRKVGGKVVVRILVEENNFVGKGNKKYRKSCKYDKDALFSFSRKRGLSLVASVVFARSENGRPRCGDEKMALNHHFAGGEESGNNIRAASRGALLWSHRHYTPG